MNRYCSKARFRVRNATDLLSVKAQRDMKSSHGPGVGGKEVGRGRVAV